MLKSFLNLKTKLVNDNLNLKRNTRPRPDLNEAHFLWLEKRRQKIAGVEGG